ncbi:alpha-1,6-mannosylglycoprotein 6-beta-N-acetylglucosaminyltransferase B-like [Engraulis encrasicolus]|uniref:alpha-1,6-mannosylglycoprotein 6-beta-N-acetylglucosaminyltransferase B-like n=1 Tax=Engraulis encrasicolus TaxID=184585 RepID=UPI002FD6FDC2
MRAQWMSDPYPCYSFYGVDGSDCSFLIYLSDIEWFCPPLAWRNHSSMPTTHPVPRIQASLRSDVGPLLEQVGTGKESLSFMRRRIRRLAAQWAAAARRLHTRLHSQDREQKRLGTWPVLVHVGFLTEESGDMFSPKVLKGGPLGEMVQWADILTALHVLGHSLRVSFSLKELQGFLGVPPGRGSCPLTGAFPFDLVYTDYHGLQQIKKLMGLSLKKYSSCMHSGVTAETHTPDNSFMGFVAEELNETERRSIQRNKVTNMAVVYGKEPSMWKVFIGFGFPYEGPAPLEAIANGCIFLQPKFQPPHSSPNHEFFRGKPTSRQVSSQHPYAEQYIGKPHVMTVDFNNSQELEAAIQEIMRTKVEPYLPYEYTCEGMLERLNAYIEHQDFCHPDAPFPLVNTSRSWPGNPPSPFTLLPNSSTLVWAPNVTAPPSWPPLSAMLLVLAPEGLSCVHTCQEEKLLCEPVFCRDMLQVQCEALEVEVSHLYPAVSAEEAECYLQKEPLLFSCAGAGPKHRRLCPCRDFIQGQQALCRDCL